MRSHKLYLSLFVGIFFACSFFLSSGSAETDPDRLNYLALGDSLTHGIQYDGASGESYADFLARQLEELHLLADFNKEFAEPGHTAANLLADVLENKEVNGVAVHTAISEADLITISAGVNDILGLIDLESFSYDQAEVETSLIAVGENLGTIIGSIKNMNPNAEVYVMGYYNAFPYVPIDVQEETILPLLTFLNEAIEQASAATGATFVHTDQAMSQNVETYLPNEENIHPSQDGYLVLANRFWQEMNLGQDMSFTDEIPHWATDEVNQLVRKGIIQGYEDGSFRASQDVSRLHAAYMIHRGVIFKDYDEADLSYADLPADFEGMDVIAKLSQNRLFEGDEHHRFNPYHSLTRGQMAKIIVEAFQLQDEFQPIYFADVTGHWAEEYIQILASEGMIKGYPDHTFQPDRFISRAEFAKMIFTVMYRDTEEMPADMPADFQFSIQFGVGKKNEVNTYTNTVTKDLIMDGTTTIELALTNEEMEEIYHKMKEVNIIENKQFLPSSVNGTICGQDPYEEDEWTITLNGKTVTHHYSNKHCEYTEDAEQILELRNELFQMIEDKEAYQQLPEPVGGYM